MLARIRTITVDCRDPALVGRFWADVLGYVDHPDDPNAPGDPVWHVVDPKGVHPNLLFVPVPEAKTVKNRVHLDLQPSIPRDEAVARVVAAGGTIVDDRRQDDGGGWVVIADPEGNELCIERSAAERGKVPVTTPIRRMQFDRASDERTMLLDLLEWYRTGVLLKVEGISDFDARKQPGRTATSIAGVVKHLAVVEDGWFTAAFAGAPDPWGHVPWDEQPDWEFDTAREEPFADAVQAYREACDRSRAVVEAHRLDDLGADERRPPFTLRFAVLHLIEETARHLGHVDVLRELADGTTGD